MGVSGRLIPLRGFNLDTADAYMPADMARYLKNVVYSPIDTSQTGTDKGAVAGMFKPIENVEVYDTTFSLPSGQNQFAGGLNSEQTNQCLFFNYNSEGKHGLYLIDGESRKIATVYLKDCLNLQLAPQHFIHEGGATLEVFKYKDPSSGIMTQRTYFTFTDGHGEVRFICIEDSLATNGFSATSFPYFSNPHPECLLINAGVPSPTDCVSIAQVVNDDASLQNNLKFNTWQFMVRFIDVYGRPSEWGDISEEYIPGENDCIGSSSLLPRCLDLSFDAGNSLVNMVEIAFRNCNDPQWYKDNTLFLYNGSNFGSWWLRQRNPSVNFNPETNTITYRFCKNKECIPIDQLETNRVGNPQPKKSQSVAKIGKFLGLGNNEHGFAPFGSDIMNPISIRVDTPTDTNSPPRNIEIYVPVYNPYSKTYQPVYKTVEPDAKWVFGGALPTSADPNNDTPYLPSIIGNYKQYFGDTDRKGFIGWLAGTGQPPTSTVSELYYVNESNNEFVKVEDFNFVFQPISGSIIKDYRRRWYMKFTFNSVSPAKYIFRIADHKVSIGDPNFAATSTYVMGQNPWAAKVVDFETTISDAAELEIDVCDANYSSVNDNKVLTIYDITDVLNDDATAVSGYITEGGDESGGDIPVELITVLPGIPSSVITPKYFRKYTDHNGFYFLTTRSSEYAVNFNGFCSCVYKRIARTTTGGEDILYENNIVLSEQDPEYCPGFATSTCSRVKINVAVTECGTGLPVPGVGVVLSRGAYVVTGADGTATIIAHDDTYVPNRIRVDNLYYTPTICPFNGCDSICVEVQQVIINPCVSCTERVIETSGRQVSFQSKRGLLSGGNYGVAIWGRDWLGRQGFAQTKDSLYFTTPTLIQSNVYSPSEIYLQIPSNIIFPEWVTELKIGITKELSMGGEYITWIVDEVEFVDNSGQENNIAPTQIKIYYASLNEYNIQNNFNTTTHWQFIQNSENGTQTNYTSDYVEFYINGDGSYFPELTRALIKYDQTGQYFLIDYDSSLKNLQKYAQIRLGRPLQCSTQDVFYQICGTIKVINGVAEASLIRLNAFDTYYKYRQIPIPIGTEENPQNALRSFGFPFEHHSPSDLWGDHCINIGKINSRNPYEAEIIRPTQIMISGALSVNGQLNYLNFFDEAWARDFDSWNFGGIVSIIPFTGGVRVICEYNCFTVGFNDNLIRVNTSGQLIVPSEGDRFGNPSMKVGNNYGCSLFDKNTIRSREDLIQYLDTSKAYLIQDNFEISQPVSAGFIDSWLRPKVKYVNEWNRKNTSKRFFIGSIDPASNGYLLSDFIIGSTSFINQDRGYDIQKQETLSFDIYGKAFRVWWSFTPQGYMMMDGNLLEKQLFSFAKNTCYYHYSTDSNKGYGTVYGEVVERVIRVVAVLDNFKKKTPLSISNYCVQSKYFSDQILTDSGQKSHILLEYFKQGDFFSAAPFLCNEDTITDTSSKEQSQKAKIIDGDNLVASTIDIRLIGDPAKNQVYSEWMGAVVEVFGQEKSGG